MDDALDYESHFRMQRAGIKGIPICHGRLILPERHEPIRRLGEIVKIDVLLSNPEEKAAAVESYDEAD